MSAADEIAIKAVGLSKVYHRTEQETGTQIPFHALHKLTFEIAKGEVVGIIGQNGSGKSTLLKILAGITKPTEGSVEIEGTVASILDIGTGIHPDLTGRENVYLRGQLLGMTKVEIDAVFDDLLDFSGVSDFIDSPVKHFSSGMFLRLAFSIIVHLKSDILLLDEVLAVGDEAFRQKCADKISEVVSSGNTVVMVSHDMNSVMNLCSKAMLLNKGQLMTIDEPLSVVSDQYLAQLAGIEQHNYQLAEFRTGLPSSEKLGFKVDGIQTTDQSSRAMLEFDADKDVYLELNYTVYKDVQLAIGIMDFLSNRLIDDTPLIRLKEEKKSLNGSFKVNWKIPANLFNPGRYHIDLYLIDAEFKTLQRFEKVHSFLLKSDSLSPTAGMLRCAFNIQLDMDLVHSPLATDQNSGNSGR